MDTLNKAMAVEVAEPGSTLINSSMYQYSASFQNFGNFVVQA